MINKREIRYLLLASIVTLGIIGCGEIIDKVEDREAPPSPANKGQYLDSNVSGIHYKSKLGCHYVEDENSTTSKEVCKKIVEGTTYNGIFGFIPGGEGVKLSVAGLELDYIPQKYLLKDAVLTVKPTDGKLASFLQSMDSDANASNGINISTDVVKALTDLNVSGQYGNIGNSNLDIFTLVQQVNEKLSILPNDKNVSEPNSPIEKETSSLQYVSETNAFEHLQNTITAHTSLPSITVEKVIDDVKDIIDNAKEYSQEEIEEKVKALRTTLNKPLKGDRGLTDIEIAKTLLDLSELTNQGYLEDIFDFKGSVDSHLSQIIKDMALDNNTPDEQRIVQYKGENVVNIVANSKKAVTAIATKLKMISDKLGVSLATAPQYYRFKYEGIDISLDNIESLRATLLAVASKLTLLTAYNLGKDNDYTPKIYTDINGNKYEYVDIDVKGDKLLNRDGFGIANNQSALNKAKNYLLQSAMIIKDLDANIIREDLNETLTNTSTESSDNQEAIDYAKNLYKVLSDNKGTFTITDEHGGDNGEKEELDIALNNLFDVKKTLSISDFGTDWKYSCEDGFKMTTEEESKIRGSVECYKSSEYYNEYDADLEPSTKAESETSKLDELITKVTLGGSVVKTGQELIDYIIDDDNNNGDSSPTTTPTTTTPTNNRDKLLTKVTKYKDDGTEESTTTYKYDSSNKVTGYKMIGSYNSTCTNSYDNKNRPTVVSCVDGNNTTTKTEFSYSGDKLSNMDYYSNDTLKMRENVIEWNGDKPKKVKRTTFAKEENVETLTLAYTGKNPTKIDVSSNNYTYTTIKKYDTKKTPSYTLAEFGYYWWYEGINNVIEEKITYNYNGQTQTSETLIKHSIIYNSSDLATRINTTITTDGNEAYQQKYHTTYEYKKAIK